MSKKKEQSEEKEPIDMTTEELLDYAIAPKVAERLKEMAQGDSQEPESEDAS